ncbi:MAG: hypothetical protein H7296_16220 [Bacteroidia bacterium]|nr:hypothetical protein [Bacteroidia bacterium]
MLKTNFTRSFKFLTCLFVLTITTKLCASQIICEFDTAYKYPYFEHGIGYTIIETHDHNLAYTALPGFNTMHLGGVQKHQLNKKNKCGKIIWSLVTDSTFCTSGCAGMSNLLEESNGDIVYAGYIDSDASPKTIRLYKADSMGNLKWNVKIGDTINYYQVLGFSKLSEKNPSFQARIQTEQHTNIFTVFYL